MEPVVEEPACRWDDPCPTCEASGGEASGDWWMWFVIGAMAIVLVHVLTRRG